MKLDVRLLILICVGMLSTNALADGQSDMIPELKEIEKIASDQETAIKQQTEALDKAQKEKEAAEKAAQEAAAKQQAQIAAQQAVAMAANTEAKPKAATKKVTTKATAPKIEKYDPWLTQERRYTFP